MANNPIAIDANDLQYYDKQIKKYIDNKDAELKASLSNLFDISEKVSANEANIISHREELDDLEARMETAYSDIADLRDNKLDESALDYLATKDYVASEISKIQVNGGDINLANYYTKAETDQAISDAISNISQPDLSEYAKKSEIPDTSEFVTNTDLDSKGFITEDILSENYATKEFVNESIASVNEKIDQIVIPTNISAFTNDANYATEQYVLDHVNEKIETEVETQVTEVVEKQVTEVVQIQVKDEVTEQLASNNKIQYGEF